MDFAVIEMTKKKMKARTSLAALELSWALRGLSNNKYATLKRGSRVATASPNNTWRAKGSTKMSRNKSMRGCTEQYHIMSHGAGRGSKISQKSLCLCNQVSISSTFYVRIFRTKKTTKPSYEKNARKMLMKLTTVTVVVKSSVLFEWPLTWTWGLCWCRLGGKGEWGGSSWNPPPGRRVRTSSICRCWRDDI